MGATPVGAGRCPRLYSRRLKRVAEVEREVNEGAEDARQRRQHEAQQHLVGFPRLIRGLRLLLLLFFRPTGLLGGSRIGTGKL